MAAAYIAIQGKVAQAGFVQKGFTLDFADFHSLRRQDFTPHENTQKYGATEKISVIQVELKRTNFTLNHKTINKFTKIIFKPIIMDKCISYYFRSTRELLS